MNIKPKTIAIAVGLIAYIVVGFFLAEYIAGAVYFMVNKTAPDGITLDTWMQYWTWYSEVPVQRKRLQIAAFIGAFLVFVLPGLVISALTSKRRSLHGDARFAYASEVRNAGLNGQKGIIVGKYNGQYLVYDGQQFVLLAAPTRSGKGVAIVVPNLLNFPESVVVLDIKLENFKLTSGFRAKHGQKVFLFSPFAEDGKTHRWNPLDGISRDRNFRIGDVLSVGQALYPGDSSKDAFWNDQARNLFLGLTLYLMDTPGLPVTLGELLRQASGKGKPLKTHLQDIMAERSTGDEALSDECLDALNRFVSTSENTMASILATFNAPLTIFANPIVDAATSTSDFDIRKVREELMSIYIGIQPNRLADAALLINLFFSQLINLNTKQLPQNNPALKYQCLMIMDEFTAIGRVGIIAKAVSYMAGYNLRLLTIIQSISQMEAPSVYGREETRTIVTNHALQVLYPPREQKDANEYSEMLGFFTEKAISTGISGPRGALVSNANPTASQNTSDQRRALLLPQELKELGQENEIIILENTKPILCQKARFYTDVAFIDRLKTLSPTLAALGSKLPTKDELELVAFVRNELASSIPTLNVDLHKAKMEQRTRYLKPDEALDLSKLAINDELIPPLDGGEPPSKESVASIVDAFFGQLDWVDADTGEMVSSPLTASPLSIDLKEPWELEQEANPLAPEPNEISLDEPSDEYFADIEPPPDLVVPAPQNEQPTPAVTVYERPHELDLSVLDI